MSSTSSNSETMSYGGLEFPVPHGVGITPSSLTDFAEPSLRTRDSRSSHADSALSNISTLAARPSIPDAPAPQVHIHTNSFPVNQPLRARSPPLEDSLPRICKRHGHADRYGHVFEPGLLDVVLEEMLATDAPAEDEDDSDDRDVEDDDDASDELGDETTNLTSVHQPGTTTPRTLFCHGPTLAILEGRDDADALSHTQGEDDGEGDAASIAAHRAATLRALEGLASPHVISAPALRTLEGFPYQVDVPTRHPPPAVFRPVLAKLTPRHHNKIASSPAEQDPLPEHIPHFHPCNVLAYVFAALPIYCPRLGARITDPGSLLSYGLPHVTQRPIT